jgi:hypothetical protein
VRCRFFEYLTVLGGGCAPENVFVTDFQAHNS